MYQGVGVRGGGMWPGVGACGRVWGKVSGVDECGRGSGLWHGWRHVARVGWCGRMQGMETCGRGGGRMWGHVTGVGVCGWGSGLWH